VEEKKARLKESSARSKQSIPTASS